MIQRRRHQSYCRLKGWFRRCRWMTARGHKHLGAIQRPRQANAFLLRQCLFQSGHVFSFFFMDMRFQVVQEGLQSGNESGVGWFEILEDLQLLFHLFDGLEEANKSSLECICLQSGVQPDPCPPSQSLDPSTSP